MKSLRQLVEDIIKELSSAIQIDTSEQLQFVEENEAIGDVRYAVFEDRIRYRFGDIEAFTFTFYFEDYEEFSELQASRIAVEFLALIENFKQCQHVVYRWGNISGHMPWTWGLDVSLGKLKQAIIDNNEILAFDEMKTPEIYGWTGRIGT